MSIRFNRFHARALATAVLALCGASAAWAQQSASVSATASATIITPISITKSVDLDFGKIAVGATGGTVALGTNDGITIAGASHTITQPASNTGSPKAATFSVGGEANFTYAITLPSSITLNSGGNSMTVDSFVSNPSGTGTLSGAGSQTLKVGATLNVGNNQAPGAYSGSFSVTVAYN